jgi:hypothetical protein
MQAVITKYLGPTNSRGTRIKAISWSGSATVGYDYSLNSGDNHKAAAQAICDNLNSAPNVIEDGSWTIEAGAEMPDGRGYAFIMKFVAA